MHWWVCVRYTRFVTLMVCDTLTGMIIFWHLGKKLLSCKMFTSYRGFTVLLVAVVVFLSCVADKFVHYSDMA